MAIKIPLVVYSGEIGQLLSGDTIGVPQTAEDVIQQTNDEATPITIGMPVYSDASDGVKKAKADATGTTNVIGVVFDASIAAAASGQILVTGVLTSANWTAVTGAAALTQGARYYLSAGTAGQLTTTAPSAVGQFVMLVGIAISTTELLLQIGPKISL